MTDKQILELLEKPMRYLSDIFSKSIKSYTISSDDLYHDLIIVYYEKKDSSRAKLVLQRKEKDISYYWYIVFKNFLLDKYRRSVKEQQILKQLQELAHEQFIEELFVKKDFII